jgi:hypothetical protein
MKAMPNRARGFAYAMGLALVASMPANANFTCGGNIAYLGFNYTGTVVVAVGGFGIWSICNVNEPIANGGITIGPETCKAWYATLLANQKANQGITFYFTSSANTSNGAECTAIGSWVAPNPLPYFMQVSGG